MQSKKYFWVALCFTAAFAHAQSPSVRQLSPFLSFSHCRNLIVETVRRWTGGEQHWTWKLSLADFRKGTPAVLLERTTKDFSRNYETRAALLTQEEVAELFLYLSNERLMEAPKELALHLNNRFRNFSGAAYYPEIEILENLVDGLHLLLAYDRKHRTGMAEPLIITLIDKNPGTAGLSLDQLVKMASHHPSKTLRAQVVEHLVKSEPFWREMKEGPDWITSDFAEQLELLLSPMQDGIDKPVSTATLNRLLVRLISQEVENHRTDLLHQNAHRLNALKFLQIGRHFFRLRNLETICDQYGLAQEIFEAYLREDHLRAITAAFSRPNMSKIHCHPAEFPTFSAFYQRFLELLVALE